MSYNLHENFLTLQELKLVTKKSEDIFNNPKISYFTNHTSWNSNIVGDSNTVLIHHLSLQYEKEVFLLLKNKLIQKFNEAPKNIMFYYWLPGSYIPFHTDEHTHKACTLYLNEVWDLNWGGLYNCIVKNKIETITPLYNLLVEQFDKMPHSVGPTRNSPPVRKTVQIFF